MIGKPKHTYIILLLLLLYLALRLGSLLTIPFMQDEAEYLFWAKNMIADPQTYLISLTQGVRPLYIWLQIPFLFLGWHVEVHEARMVSLVSGIFTMLALYLLSNELFKNKKISLLSVIIFIFFPFAQIYNAVSVFESTVSAFMLFTLLFSLKLVKKPRLLLAIGFGILLGLGMLTKKHASFNAYFLPFSFLLYPSKNISFKKIRNISLFVLLALGIAFGMQQILKTSPYFERIAWYEGGVIYTKKAWLIMPFSQKIAIFMNTSRMWTSFLSYITLPYVFLIGVSFFYYKKYWRELIILMAYFIIPALSMAFFVNRASEHWMYPMTVTLIPLIALGLYSFEEKVTKFIKKKYPKIRYTNYSIYALFIVFPIYFNFMLIFNPLASPLVPDEKDQYYKCTMELFVPDKQMLEAVAKEKKILIGTENDKGFKNFMATQLWDNKNISVNGYWPKRNELPAEIITQSKKMPVYWATLRRDNYKYPNSFPVKIISQRSSISCVYTLYKVN